LILRAAALCQPGAGLYRGVFDARPADHNPGGLWDESVNFYPRRRYPRHRATNGAATSGKIKFRICSSTPRLRLQGAQITLICFDE